MFSCSFCGKGFNSRYNHQRHEATHKPPILKCSHCPKRFRQQSNLVRHLKIHTQPRSIVEKKECGHCGKEFKTKAHLKRHEKIHDSGCSCKFCRRRFRHSEQLDSHMQDHRDVAANPPNELEKKFPTASEPPPPEDQLAFDETLDIPTTWPVSARDQYRANWSKIRSQSKSINPRVEQHNIRIPPDFDIASTLKLWLRDIYSQQKYKFRLQLQFGYFLTQLPSQDDADEGDIDKEPSLRHYYNSNNTTFFSGEAPLISDRTSLERNLDRLDTTDLIEWATANRESSHWSFLAFTNVTVRIVKLLRHPIRGGIVSLPAFITANKNIYGLLRNRANGRLYNDNKCVFRCIALPAGSDIAGLETATERHLAKWCETVDISPQDFDGITVNQFPLLEKIFKMRLHTWEFALATEGRIRGYNQTDGDPMDTDDPFTTAHRDGEGDLYDELAHEEEMKDDPHAWNLTSVALSKLKPSKQLLEVHVVLYDNHFCFVKNIDSCLQSFQCPTCSYVFASRNNFNRHVRICKGVQVEHKFPGGGFHMPRNVFENLELFDIHIPESERYRAYFAVFDSESFQQKVKEAASGKLQFLGECIPASFAVCSNIPGFTEASCSVSDGDPEKLASKLVEQLFTMQTEAARRSTERNASYLDSIHAEISRLEELAGENTPCELFFFRRSLELRKLLERFERALRCLPVFTFNGAKFDIPLLRKYLFPQLVKSKSIGHVIKKNSGYISLAVNDLLFLDAVNFLSAGCSYDQMLRSFKVSHSKFFWPYDWFTSLDQLELTQLPDQDAFYSRLKQTGISDENYRLVQETWKRMEWRNMRDYLVYYNKQDVEPFVEAISKMREWWRGIGIDMLSQGVSLPSLALRHLYKNMKAGFVMPLVNAQNEDLFWTMRHGVVGGPSFVFHRYHEKGLTRIRGNGRVCQRICGLDCNALYLWCTMQELPVSVFYRWRLNEVGKFTRRNMYEKTLKETQWITWMAYNQKRDIRHQFNGKQVDFGCGGMHGAFKKVPVDGYCSETKTIYQFYGCHWHSHGCWLDPSNNAGNARERTDNVTQYLRSLGYKVEYIWECDFDEQVKQNKNGVGRFIEERYSLKFDGRTEVDAEQIIDAVRNGSFFGMVEVDISVPDHLKEKFQELQPIFKNREVSREDLSGFTARYAKEHDLLKRPQRMLLASYSGEKILLITPLLKWYLEHGLIITKVYQAFQAVGSRQFEEVGESVAQARRDADHDPQQKMRGEMSKTVGNCFYGRSITDVTKHKDITFCGENEVDKLLRNCRFSDCALIDPTTYEIAMRKKAHTFDLPFLIGVFVYQYAKLRMLSCFYDFLSAFIPQDCFQLCQMDTDSFYFAISDNSIEELIPPALFAAFQNERLKWLPRDDTSENRAFDKRTPGLFKVEWEGDGLVCLTSKLYYGWSSTESPKIACKGVRRLNDCISKDNYLHTLRTGEIIGGENMGFRMHNEVLKAYLQKKAAITGFYAKRPLCDDGISTTPCLL